MELIDVANPNKQAKVAPLPLNHQYHATFSHLELRTNAVKSVVQFSGTSFGSLENQ